MFIPIYGWLGVQAYGLAICLGIVAAFLLSVCNKRYMNQLGIDHIANIVTGSIFAGIIGARVLNGITEYHNYTSLLSLLSFWKEGYDSWGAVLGIMVFAWVYEQVEQLPAFTAFDFIAFYCPLVQAFGRIGCFLNGCCGGVVAKLPWGVLNEHGFLVHPTQLYSSLCFGVIFAMQYCLSRHKAVAPGQLSAYYLMASGFERCMVDIFRDDRLFVWWSPWISVPQIISLCMILFGIILWFLTRYTPTQTYEHLQ